MQKNKFILLSYCYHAIIGISYSPYADDSEVSTQLQVKCDAAAAAAAVAASTNRTTHPTRRRCPSQVNPVAAVMLVSTAAGQTR